MVQAVLIGMVAVFLAMMLKNVKPEYSSYISLAACLILIGFSVTRLSWLAEKITELKGYFSLQTDYMPLLLKMIGITYLAQIGSALCKDAGYQAVSGQIELVGKLSILVMGMPVLLTLLETISGIFS